MRTSLYSTALKVHSSVDIESFQKNVKLESHYYNYFKFLGKWEAAFGIDAIHARLFDPRSFVDGDIRKDFLSVALPDLEESALTFETRTANESMSTSMARIYQTVNSARARYVGRFRDPTTEEVLSRLSELAFLDNGQPIVDRRQEAMFELFYESNLDFFERYFGTRDNLFLRPTPNSADERDLNLGIDQVCELIEKLVGHTRLIALQNKEINGIRDLATRLHDENAISKAETVFLLRIAHRARPNGGQIAARLQDLTG